MAAETRQLRAARRLIGLGVAALVVAAAPAAADPAAAARGAALFARPWHSPAEREVAVDGLGPLFNARSCTACHPAGGRAAVTQGGGDGPAGEAFVVRLGDDPALGRQLQTAAAPGLAAEGRVWVAFAERTVRLADGASVALRQPRLHLEEAGPALPAIGLSGRLAPRLGGVGLLARIPDAELARNQERHGGRLGRDAAGRIGRFGFKAAQPTLEALIAQALSLDLGLGSPVLPAAAGDCTAAQTRCRAMEPASTAPALPPAALEALVIFVSRLRGPPATPAAPVDAGRQLFDAIGCAACHRPAYTVAAEPRVDGVTSLTIRPYSDLLLHDLGAPLADAVSEGAAQGHEWRTAPLWGLGAMARDGAPLLHDGRARTVLEAILWHEGRALAARDAVRALPVADRARLLDFLLSL